MDYLADDRDQEECRVLMNFWWQLSMSYQEVTEADLDRHVGPATREAVSDLVVAIRQSPDAIDRWIRDTVRQFTPVHDRGYQERRARVARTDAEIAADLASAGIEFIEPITTDVSLPLPAPGRWPASCRTEDGRFDSEAVKIEDPDMPAKVNAGWWRMAQEFDLLDDRQEFLLSVDYAGPEADESDHRWVRVRLTETWNLAGSGSTALGCVYMDAPIERFVLEFAMLSTDQKMILNTTVWGDATVSTVVIRPDRLQ
ncbi:hypothetical protein [Actinoplanes sp. L3-i22]|uniref:hypothetical protein n=1 Tax=Actinoplanes sp. L3-i22 TaxID=2836373 RepID=UPI0021078AA3|nr:hypothetical protein [Actinoplanes sp. L3-i22]